MSRTIPFHLDAGRPLEGRLTLPDGPGPFPVVVVAHGFKGFLDWGFFPALASLLAERRLAVVRFNFSGAGVRPGEDFVSDLDAFRRNTISQELDDLGTVLAAVGTDLAPESIDRDRIGLVGHSRGGGVAVLAASGDDPPVELRALVTWAAVATFDRFPPEAVDRWRRQGAHIIVNARTGQELPLGVEILDDFERNREQLDLEAAASAVRPPWLIVHGDVDPTVPVDEGRSLAALAPNARYVEIAGGDHVFGASHPFHGPTPPLIEALNETQAWLCPRLRAET